MNPIVGNILVAVSCFLFGYLIGGIPNGVIIGRIFFGKDPRDYGSHNSGGTNSGRVFGKWIGFLVIFLDMMKAVIAFYAVWAVVRFSSLQTTTPLWDDGVFYIWLTGLGVSVGHCWSPYLNFKGGKTVACFMGLVGGTSWLGFIVCCLSFFPFLFQKKIVSRSSLFSGAIIVAFEWVMYLIVALSGWDGTILMWNFGAGGGLFFGWESASVVTAIYLIMVLRHSQNIKRLKAGTESKLDWSGK
ncbi:MAG: glycerol-3-phosphate 1-O-acyltransferase PlsY [Bacilli bacterium]|jgi:glycerol-3-phosphate acyltransferase PlsY|nr:glycerol-3-phosphate 1-O-acyltransferase PlsY [Bacilli bacterium]MCH4210503.1 glycerol-3-phosphate 1-O-acyltransferase PlsY [Bacilli bacterium]MCH4228273.1 glycerol-3-phosphate 1-O-acyltransferase PlsY [Bacilli bacterium]MCH4277707.1 glycerol-3-phosphate 1-O-acyltransferase PlsY [Bacilli bacterium]MCI2054694.1 glycerol-3-phosphate 1-O-acyltransferase PlsY [Bacilli bacterium]